MDHLLDWTFQSRRRASALSMVRQARAGSEGGERAGSVVGSADDCRYHFKRIRLEAGPFAMAFQRSRGSSLPVICVETRHMRAELQAQIDETDRNDARGIAQMMRAGLYRPVHVKTLRSQKLRMLLTHRKLLQGKAIAIENDLRGTLRNFGLKVGPVGKLRFETRIKELVANLPDLAVLIEPLLVVRRCCASNSPSYIAACWPSFGTMRCAGG